MRHKVVFPLRYGDILTDPEFPDDRVMVLHVSKDYTTGFQLNDERVVWVPGNWITGEDDDLYDVERP